MHIGGFRDLLILSACLLLHFAHCLQHGGQEARVEMPLRHFEVFKGRLTFLSGPSEAARQVHGALNLRNVTLF